MGGAQRLGVPASRPSFGTPVAKTLLKAFTMNAPDVRIPSWRETVTSPPANARDMAVAARVVVVSVRQDLAVTKLR